MTDDFFPEARPTRPIWLVTLADLALLLVGFFVLVQATQKRDFQALAKGLRGGFGVQAAGGNAAPPRPQAKAIADPMPVGVAAMTGFATGSSVLPQSPDALIDWVRDQTRDPRMTLRIIGSADGSPGDVEKMTMSASVLAVDRARGVAAALASGKAISADRMTIVTDVRAGGPRGVTLTVGFAGGRP